MKRLLIAGFGDIARRARPLLESRFGIHILSRAAGTDLDRPKTLAGLSPVDVVLHSAPPPSVGANDCRTANLLSAFENKRILPTRVIYISTSGVYGNCDGALVDESRDVNPQTARAKRRIDAESQLARWCGARNVALVVLRAPGIYAADRLPVARLRSGTPALRDADDVFTNHIHADDLAAICVRATEDDAPAGIYNASDDTRMKMGQWLDFVADFAGLPRPTRIARADAAGRIPAELLSFMSESRRLDNTRMKQALGVRLRYPTVREGLKHERVAGAHQPA
ncbi:MAG: SDR family NAD(P)-dependent oxidoreductase [Betaproteobacteria bacterium]|nr:SDR family NAD(P)-dependent oxidoreductase [Betaproteobacteria bacterium]